VSQMRRHVDFSLGMSAISSGADMGDVYDKPRPKVPTISTTSPSPAPDRRSRDVDDTGSLARTSSRDSDLARITSSGSNRTHRNRFFSRNRTKFGPAEEGMDMEDLEAGAAGALPMVDDMPPIEEASGANSANLGTASSAGSVRFPEAPAIPGARIDPRTGIVSPQAVHRDSARDRGELPMASGPRRAMTDQLRR